METIYKYELEMTDLQEIEMPKYAEILCVQMQNEKPFIWAKVESENKSVKRPIIIIGTGNPMPANPSRYIGTFQLHGGVLVFHVFELI